MLYFSVILDTGHSRIRDERDFAEKRKKKLKYKQRDAFCVCRSKAYTETTLCLPEIEFSSTFGSDFQEVQKAVKQCSH